MRGHWLPHGDQECEVDAPSRLMPARMPIHRYAVALHCLASPPCSSQALFSVLPTEPSAVHSVRTAVERYISWDGHMLSARDREDDQCTSRDLAMATETSSCPDRQPQRGRMETILVDGLRAFCGAGVGKGGCGGVTASVLQYSASPPAPPLAKTFLSDRISLISV